ncbi:MAG: glycosyltransferase family 2 protein [Solirubrobacterales bacterium]|nr:glycosyltransferase family 2 protein [Solirubrobacterales bacterium]
MPGPDDSSLPAAGGTGGPSLSVVVVTHDSAPSLRRTLPAIVAELRAGDELIVCDNQSADDTLAVVADLAPGARLIETGGNLGFGAACNRGAAAAAGELLLFLNPDNVVEPGFRDAIELPALEGRDWGAWQGLVADAEGRINTRGGVVHFTGIAWAGGAGEPRAAAPPGPEEVTFPSGACLAIPRAAWERVGGFSEQYFLYHEDTDLGLRLLLAGMPIGIEPRAVSDHDYEFDKGPDKWRYLERNRWATLIRDYPGRLLLLLTPAFIATELSLLAVAAVGGWLSPKLKANVDVARDLSRLLAERRAVQATAAVDAAGFAQHLVADLDSEFLGAVGRSRLIRTMLRGYWALVQRLL